MQKPPIIGAHLRIQDTGCTDALCRYIKESLGPLGVNLLVLELNPGYDFKCYPELSSGSFGKEDAKKVAACAKEAGIRVAPLFMCLGHQGWAYGKNPLLTHYPEFDETPDVTEGKKSPDLIAGKPIHNTPNGIFYCHSWCASNDDVYKYVFPMIDEIMEDFGADALHVGMDETFSIAEDSCPRCVGKGRADLFAHTVNTLHNHIVKEKGWQMLMWSDRLNNAKEHGYHEWEGDVLGIWRAADMIPTDILLCDWHYDMNERGFPGFETLMEKGFTVLPSGWRDLKQTKFLLDETRKYAKVGADKNLPGKMAGMMITCWSEATGEFINNMNELVKTRIHDEENKDSRGIASSLVYVANELKGE